MTWTLALALLLAGPGEPPAPQKNTRSHWMKVTPAERDAQLRAALVRPLPERLLAVSHGFLETPYLHSPLGEGQGVDPDPPLRYDAVDCLTFVETAMAMSLAEGPEDVPAVLERLRYAGRPVYEERNHLMEAQWLPNNVAKGYLRDVTADFAGPDLRQTTHELSPRSWQSPSSRQLLLPKERQPLGRFSLPLLPLDKAPARLAGVPEGTVLVVVREERPWKVTRITHLGFLVRHQGRVHLRHASRNPFGRVVDENLDSFLTRNRRYEKWPVSGVALYQVLRPTVAGAP